MGVFPKKSPSSRITGPIEKIKGDAKMAGHPLSLSKVWWRSAPARRRKKGKLGVFCLSVFTLRMLNRMMFSHSNSDIVANWRSILMRISSFSGKQMLFQMFKRCLNYAARWRHTCLRISSKFEFCHEPVIKRHILDHDRRKLELPCSSFFVASLISTG